MGQTVADVFVCDESAWGTDGSFGKSLFDRSSEGLADFCHEGHDGVGAAGDAVADEDVYDFFFGLKFVA